MTSKNIVIENETQNSRRNKVQENIIQCKYKYLLNSDIL